MALKMMPSNSRLNSDISQVIDQISLQALPLITNNCKDCKYICLYVFMSFLQLWTFLERNLSIEGWFASCHLHQVKGAAELNNLSPGWHGTGRAPRHPLVPCDRTMCHRLRLLETSNYREGPHIRFATEVAPGEPQHNNHIQTLPRSISIHPDPSPPP